MTEGKAATVWAEMTPAAVRGAAAGAVGKLALDMVTYLDMLLRGRAASDLPERAAEQMARRLGIDLAGPGRSAHRRQALAAVMGYSSGLALGGLYGVVTARRRETGGWIRPGMVAGLAAMAGTALPSTVAGLTDPRCWGLVGWLEDLVPHLAYGLVTAGTHRALFANDRRRVQTLA